jgi:hypothetical protein
MKLPIITAAIVFALTNNGMAAQMTQLPGLDVLIGHPCHDQYLLERGNLYAKINVLKGEIKAQSFNFNQVGLPDGTALAPPICALLRQIDQVQDEILSTWNAERQCNPSAADQSIFQSKISDRLKNKARTEKKLRQCGG